MTQKRRPVVLIIRDGWGHNPNPEFNDCNAVHLASTPVNDRLLREFPHTQIRTSGEDVGLPDGIMGNSEVGHQNIGAGRIVNQQLMRISHAIRDQTFFENRVLQDSVAHVARTRGNIHLLGLLSDGGVHSHFNHAVALVEFYKQRNVASDKVVVHAITDGRDTAPNSGLEFVHRFEKELRRIGTGRMGSVIGRFYAMDRDFRWERVADAYNMLVRGAKTHATAADAVRSYYEAPTSTNQAGDEFISPASITSDSEHDSNVIKSGDAVIFFNFRGDRPRELTKAFVFDDVDWNAVPKGGFDRGSRPDDLFFATMAEYEKGLPTRVIFPMPDRMRNTLGEVLAAHGLIQLRCAESEKHPHVTYFFNDYKTGCFPRELQLDLPSPKHVPTYDSLPEMSATAVTDGVVNAIWSEIFDFILVNFANADMVGHTGRLQAAISAAESVDTGVGRIVDAVLESGGAAIVTADHGNCEQMIDPETGGPHTKHTTYDVDLIVVDDTVTATELTAGGRLADVAPTVLHLLGLPQPNEMTGVSLIPPTDADPGSEPKRPVRKRL